MPTPQDADAEPAAASPRGLRIGGGAIVAVVALAALLIFMVQNTADVRVRFLAWDFTWSVWLLTFVSALLGAVIWIGLGVVRRHRRRAERRQEGRA